VVESLERKRESRELMKIVMKASEDNVKAWMGDWRNESAVAISAGYQGHEH